MEIFIFNAFISFVSFIPALLICFGVLWYINKKYSKNWKLVKYFFAATAVLFLATALQSSNTPKNKASKQHSVQYAPRKSEKEFVPKKSIHEEAKQDSGEFEKLVDWQSKLENK